jgi:hypothetical protein
VQGCCREKHAPLPQEPGATSPGNGAWADYTVSSTRTLVLRDGSLHELVSIDRGNGAIRPMIR